MGSNLIPRLARKMALAAYCAAFCIGAVPVLADGGFTFKKVGVPTKPIGKRIDVQITPAEDYYKNQPVKKESKDAGSEKVAAANVVPSTPSDLQDWFWDANSPALVDASSGRLEQALQSLTKNPTKLAAMSPKIAHMQNLAEKFGGNILLATLGTDVSPAFVLAVIGVESAGRADVVSGAGAVGLMQLIPDTAKRFNVTDSTDPAQNIKGGAAYLDWLLKEFNKDPLLALAGYNAGENAVKKHGGVPPYAETRAYVPKVVAAWQVARTLCMTPPQYVTDGCVFKTRAIK
jgi:soluble lytic murein transglycosylase-like protein